MALTRQDEDDLPRCYYENTTKEELVLEHVLEYKRQFKLLYGEPDRKLLLAPKNECGKRKFICTTIRPTKLPYTELYDWERCAKFVSDFLEYEELDPADAFPKYIPSPCNVLKWQAGDCFDYSIVLCSMLIGSGYDAYCVYGSAPKKLTTNDESLMPCPFPLEYEEGDDSAADPDEEKMKLKKDEKKFEVSGFGIPPKQALVSDFQQKTQKQIEDESRLAHYKANTIDDD